MKFEGHVTFHAVFLTLKKTLYKIYKALDELFIIVNGSGVLSYKKIFLVLGLPIIDVIETFCKKLDQKIRLEI